MVYGIVVNIMEFVLICIVDVETFYAVELPDRHETFQAPERSDAFHSERSQSEEILCCIQVSNSN